MLLLSPKLKNQPVLSLRTGSKVAEALGPLINPDNLIVIGFLCRDNFTGEELVMLNQDIREHINRGFVVNDHEVLARPDDLVRFERLLDIKYDLIGKTVVSDQGRKLGKVSDYAVESKSFYIKKIYVAPRLLKSLTGSSLSIDRRQVIEVTDKKIVVKDADVKEEAPELSAAPAPS